MPHKDKELAPLIKAAKDQGWEVTRTKKTHLVFISPSGEKVFSSSTPSDWRAVKNILTKLKKSGLKA